MVTTNCVLAVSKVQTGTEPVTIAEVKENMGVDFTEFDDLLARLITSVRSQFEESCNISIVEHTVTATVQNDLGYIRLPYGPVQSVTTTGLELIGDKLKTRGCEVAVIYEAGFNPVPADICQAIIEEVTYQFENSGDTVVPGLSPQALDKISKYNYNQWFL